jgi:transaldolase
MTNLLDQLKEMTVVVADTGDIDSIEAFTPRDATTNPSLIQAAAGMAKYSSVVDAAIAAAKEEAGADAAQTVVVDAAIDRLAVEFGRRILEIIPGRVSTEVDARLSFDTDATIAKAKRIIGLYADHGIGPDRILIKIASTWEGIRASEVLEKQGIHCNLTLLFGLHQAVACAEAKATLISPFVGRILDWYKKDTGRDSYPSDEDPGVVSVTQIYNYYKKFGHKTEVMGASFRNLGEICELAGCDLLTIAPKFLKELQDSDATLPLKLSASTAKTSDIAELDMTKALYDEMHVADRMANEKLAEGIEKFAAAQVELEGMLAVRLA